MVTEQADGMILCFRRWLKRGEFLYNATVDYKLHENRPEGTER